MVPLTFGRDIFNEATFAQAAWIITDGDEPLTIQWSFHGHNISSDQGITTTNIGTRTSILSIGSVSHSHRGNYTCRASNLAGDRTYTAELKVNGRKNSIALVSSCKMKQPRGYRKSLFSNLYRSVNWHALHYFRITQDVVSEFWQCGLEWGIFCTVVLCRDGGRRTLDPLMVIPRSQLDQRSRHYHNGAWLKDQHPDDPKCCP